MSAPLKTYFATCSRGLELILAEEIRQLGGEKISPGRGGVAFQGNQLLLYRTNLWLRTAIRILCPIWEGDVHSPDELYEAVSRIPWDDYLTADHTLAVDCNLRDSLMTHSQYASRRVKDAVCDWFRTRTGRRPSVDAERPMVGLNLHIAQNHAVLSLDSSWQSLHKRGYRGALHRAPLNEALAAGLLLQSGWKPSEPLVDLMCGSGTFCIEAAWMATRRAPGLTRSWYGFQGWPGFDRPLWNALREEAKSQMLKSLPAFIGGSDRRRDAVANAQACARSAGIGHLLSFQHRDLIDARPPVGPPGVLICNPPYGERLGEEKALRTLYRKLGDITARHWPQWRLFVFTANDRLARLIPRKPLSRKAFYNGKIPCQLWEFH